MFLVAITKHAISHARIASTNALSHQVGRTDNSPENILSGVVF